MPSIALPVSLRGQLLSGVRSAVAVFSPLDLFATGSQGIWLDPSDLSTMFSDRAGTTAVTTPGTVVGLRLDKSKGLALGADVVVNGGFTTDTGWAKDAGWTISSGVLRATSAGLGTGASQSIGYVANKTVKITLDVTVSAGKIEVWLGGIATFDFQAISITASGTYTCYAKTSGTDGKVYIRSLQAGTSGTVDNISVRELAGNHAVAPTDAARPIYGVEPKGGRRNLLTWSEDFGNAVWGTSAATVSVNSTATTAPDGTNTADLLAADGTSASHFLRAATGSWTAGGTFTETVYIKRNTGNFAHLLLEGVNAYLQFSLADGSTTFSSAGTATNFAVSVTPVGIDDWYRARLTATNTGASTFRVRYYVLNASNNTAAPSETTTASMFIWGAQLELGSTATNYQRVTTAYDITESGVATCHYVQFDGSDDSLSTSAIDFTGTDKMSVFAGVRKLSDAAIGLVAELSSGYGSNAGSFNLTAPDLADGTRAYATQSRGAATAASTQRSSTATGAAPDSAVLSGLLDISGDSSVLRRNGVASTAGTGDQGTGNYGNHSMFFGRRNNATLPFNGKDYGIIVVGKAASAGEITDTELWLSDKTAEVDVAKSISPNIYTRSGDTILDRANSIIERRTV